MEVKPVLDVVGNKVGEEVNIPGFTLKVEATEEFLKPFKADPFYVHKTHLGFIIYNSIENSIILCFKKEDIVDYLYITVGLE